MSVAGADVSFNSSSYSRVSSVPSTEAANHVCFLALSHCLREWLDDGYFRGCYLGGIHDCS